MSNLAEISSIDELALFNPAFLSVLIHGAVKAHEKSASHGMPTHLTFLLVPLALHRPTRGDLPANAAAQMQKWIRQHPRHIAGLDKRVISMRPFIGIALRFALLHGVIEADGTALRAGTLRRRPREFANSETDDALDCQRVARFLGRWFARQPDSATLLAMWGFRP